MMMVGNLRSRVGTLLMEEKFGLTLPPMKASKSLLLKPQWVYLLLPNLMPLKLLFTGSPTFRIDRGVNGVSLPSDRTHLTMHCLAIPERSRCSWLTTASSAIAATRIF